MRGKTRTNASAATHIYGIVCRRKYGASRWGGMVASAVSRGKKPVDTVVGELTEDTALEEGQFRDLLEKIDRGLRALPATAQARRLCFELVPGCLSPLID